MHSAINRYPPGSPPLLIESNPALRAQASWRGVQIEVGNQREVDFQLDSIQARTLGEWLLAAANQIDSEG